jgi:hypothetical protein
MDDKEIKRDEKGRFLEGVSGNPKGRPADGESLTGILKEYLNSKKTIKSKSTRKEVLIERLYEKAEAGDLSAIRLILGYTDGLPTQRISGSMSQQIINNPKYIAIRGLFLKLADGLPDPEERGRILKELDEIDSEDNE